MIKLIKNKSYDARLNTDVCDEYNNAELTITMKLAFKQVNPAGGAAKGTYHNYGDPTEKLKNIVKWNPLEWQAWIKNFENTAQKYWHGKFWLLNNSSQFEYLAKGNKYIPNVWCRFELIAKDASAIADPHHTIEVVRLDPSERWFGSHSLLYDNLDTQATLKGRDSKGNRIMQIAHIHEVGHLLGLEHVDIGKPHCPRAGNTNLGPCYGVLDVNKNSVMGMGMQLRPEHATPWRLAMIQIASNWSLKALFTNFFDWTPKLTRHYPRTPAEVAANTLITTRPKR